MEMIYSNQVIKMIQDALNLVDSRLVDHGVHVAAIMKDMLEVQGVQDEELKKNLYILALLHDVGAYQTEEIDNLVQFETDTIWQHAVYGYLFLKEFAPFGELTKVILYHHAEYGQDWKEEEEIMRYAFFLHVADRADIWYRDNAFRSEEDMKNYFLRKSGTVFSPEAVKCFLQANERFGTLKKLERPMSFEEIADFQFMEADKIETYLHLLIHAIDFRSHVTVTHTVSVVEIACQLAKRLRFSKEEQKQIYYGALMHDLGKIGTPVSILEKPGKLTEEEMEIMRNHVVLSRRIIHDCIDEKIEKIALCHHEKLNGRGYPLGLSGAELGLAERIVAVADIVSALCMNRSYKDAFPKERVLAILHNMQENGEIDGDVVGVMEKDYDDILKQADRACRPTVEAYERIYKEYPKLLAFFE